MVAVHSRLFSKLICNFQVAVGCGEYTDSCLTNHSIRLEYTKEPGSGKLSPFKDVM